MAADALVPGATSPRVGAQRRLLWLIGTLGATAGAIALAPVVAPSASANPSAALGWVLFLGSSVHVASTAWFYSVPEVRRHMSTHRARYVWTPVALVVIGAVTAAVVSSHVLAALTLAFFAWQFHHFQKQNLGIAALTARTCGARGPSELERRVLVAAGFGGVLALVGHSSLLQLGGLPRWDWLFRCGAVVVAAAGVTGVAVLTRRARTDRPFPFVAAYLLALAFFVPPLVFTSPYAAVAGLTIAHSAQYLLLVGLVAATPADGRSAAFGLAVLVCVALMVGLGLNRLSHLHGTGVLGNALYGVFLGLSCAHFVVDAGLWRLRDEFPRAFLRQRVPYLLIPG